MRHELVSMDELLPGEPRAVDVDGLSILIVRTPDDQVFALRNVCSHMGAKLSNGRVYCPLKGSDAGRYELADTYVIQCPWHGIEFDVATGRSLADPERTRLRRFNVRVEDGTVVLER